MNSFNSLIIDDAGWVVSARHCLSPNFDERPIGVSVELLVIHNISLPPFEYGGDAVEQLFTNKLNSSEHPFFAEIISLRVSSHFFIRRNGELVQFVPILKRAWHAGVSSWKGRANCNDFSIGIELEGCDFEAYEEAQYLQLIELCKSLLHYLPLKDLVGHSDIASGRKTDPGLFFDWNRLHTELGV